MNRGSTMATSMPANGYSRFNEAPIHESGKSGRIAWHHRQMPGFNEAPIHESGKFVHANRGLASQGARFNEAPIHESGKSIENAPDMRIHACFNEAPIHESGKFVFAGFAFWCMLELQ